MLSSDLLAWIATTTLVLPTTAIPLSLHVRTTGPVQQIIAVAPTSASCANAPVASECATASQALSPILAGFAKYNIATAAEQAALLSWMAFESDDFKYNINHFPGTPGQGTRCMMSPTFVKEYVSSLSELQSNLTTATTPAEILALVEGDEYSFASASWFYSTQCSSTDKTALQTGTDHAWQGWITGCVQTTVTDARQQYWERAKTALSV